MTVIPFPLRSHPAPFKFQGEARLVNVYPEDIGQENRGPVAFLAIPGIKAFWSGAAAPCRGLIWASGFTAVYSLHGSTLYKVTPAGSGTAIPGIISGSGPVVWEVGPERFRQAEVTITVASPAVVTWRNHHLAEGSVIRFTSSGELPTGLAPDTDYYVLASGLTDSEFQVSATEGGSAIDATGVISGTVTATSTEATRQIVIVSDNATYVVENDIITRLKLEEEANAVTILANRFVLSTPSGRNYYSELNDALTVDPLSYFTAESRPDGMVRAFADGGQLYLFGLDSTEVYQSNDDANAAFVPVTGTYINKGCASRDSVCSFDNAPHWLGHDNIVYRVAGYQAERVSTYPVERAIKAVADKTTIRAYVDTDEGHSFYVLTCDQWTWVYDAATRVWHERASRNRPDWRAWPYINAFGLRIVGDKASPALNTLDAVHDELGDAIRCELTLPDVPGVLIHNLLELDVAAGAGLNVAEGEQTYEPKIMLSWSDDGGHTWSNERTLSVGRKGQWNHRVRFTRLGMARTIRGRRYRVAHAERTVKSFLLADLSAESAA